MSFTAAGTVGGLSIDDSDIVKFTATSLGSNTQGSFSWYLDGSDVGLTTSGEDINALDVLDNGDLLISTTGSFSGNGASGADEDLFRFSQTAIGANSAGTFSRYLDGSDLGLGRSSEDIDGLGVENATTLNFSTVGNLSASGATAADEDISLLTLTSTGSSSSGSIASTLVFDGSAFGIGGTDVNALDVPSGPADTEAPEVTVTAPNGGEQWAAGSTQTITWTATDNVGVSNVDISFSTNGGQTYTTLATGEANDGSYSWSVPNLTTSAGVIQIVASDGSGNSGTDTSDQSFSIIDATLPAVTVTAPNGGETWSVGTVQDITWTASDNIGVTTVDINFSSDNGNSFTSLVTGQSNTGNYAWTVPGTATTAGIIQVIARDAAGNVAADSSNNTFTISEPDTTAPQISLVSPNGGQVWGTGSSQTITWVATDNVGVTGIDLAVSLDNGATFTPIASGETNDGAYQWTVPDSLTENALIRVTASDAAGNQASDDSDNTFAIRDLIAPTVTVTSPNGGEAWTVGSTRDITWVANDNLGVNQIDIYYSDNGGTTFTAVALGETNDGTYSWSLPTTPTETAIIRVIAQDAAGNSTADESNGTFSIVEVNNSEILYFSTQQNISFAGLTVRDEDIVSYDGSTFEIAFDGSDVGVGGLDIDALTILSPTEILMSFTAAGTVGALSFDDSDILKFTATQLGTTTAGSFSLYFDGSDVGLSNNGEDIDALTILADGRLAISTTGRISANGASGRDEDVFAFNATSLGANTAGSFSILFDGGDVGMSNSSEDIDALHISETNQFSLSTNGELAANGITSSDEDIVLFTPISLGGSTAGNFDSTPYFDGSAFGLGGTDINALDRPSTPLAVGTINVVGDDAPNDQPTEDDSNKRWRRKGRRDRGRRNYSSNWQQVYIVTGSPATEIQFAVRTPTRTPAHVKAFFRELGERTSATETWANSLHDAVDEWFRHLGR